MTLTRTIQVLTWLNPSVSRHQGRQMGKAKVTEDIWTQLLSVRTFELFISSPKQMYALKAGCRICAGSKMAESGLMTVS